MTPSYDLDAEKRHAALKATEFVRDGMVVGLGTGTTSKHLILALGSVSVPGSRFRLSRPPTTPPPWHDNPAFPDRVRQCLDDRCRHRRSGPGRSRVESRERRRRRAAEGKIVAAAAKQFIVMVDHTKLVPGLGGSFPLPIEVVPFGWGSTARNIEQASGGKAVLRERNGTVFQTEAGHVILDLHMPKIPDPATLEIELNQIPGIVETGLFIGRTSILIVGHAQGVDVTHASKP
ncbi:MAG: ribose-5-phosphate isomerase A [Nitrospira sp.]|nr:ribose-5-phosphate isomerase A [Nitrospira sp.]